MDNLVVKGHVMKQSDFQFQYPCLDKMNFTVNHEFNSDKTEIEMANSFNIEVKKDASAKTANVALILKVNENKVDTPFQMEAVISSDFRWSIEDEKKIDRMLETNAPALLLSYLRPIVANLTALAKMPPYHLPFFDFTK